MLHAPQLTPSQRLAHAHHRKFTSDIERAAKVIPIINIVHLQEVKVTDLRQFGPVVVSVVPPKPDDIFGPIVCLPADRIRIEEIIHAVGRFYQISKHDILSQRRTCDIVGPRHVCMYLAKVLTLQSLPSIGRRMGKRDHTTVLSAVRKIERVRREDPALESDLQKICFELGQVLRPAAFPSHEAPYAAPLRE